MSESQTSHFPQSHLVSNLFFKVKVFNPDLFVVGIKVFLLE